MRRFAQIATGIVWTSLFFRLALDVQTAIELGYGPLFGVLKFGTAFTHLTNALIGLVFLAYSLRSQNRFVKFFTAPWLVACAATYITVMALTWKIMLAPSFAVGIKMLVDSIDLNRIVGTFLHGANPALFLLYWLFAVPKRQLNWRMPLWWPTGAMVYFAVMMIRGAVTHVYPYPFVNASVLGYPRVLLNAAILLSAFVAAGMAYVAIDKWGPNQQRRGAGSSS